MSQSLKLLTLTLATIGLCGCVHSAKLKPFAGQWVLRQSGENLMVLRTSLHHGRLSGVLISPKHFTEQSSGIFTDIAAPIEQKSVHASNLKSGSLELVVGIKPDRDRLPMNLMDGEHAQIHWANDAVPPWNFERVPDTKLSVLSGQWSDTSEPKEQTSIPK